ncbi:MAG: T9SS type A sorting domain-containing protein [Ignavibacteria bacterium]
MKLRVYIFLVVILSINLFAQNTITPNGKVVGGTTQPVLTQGQIDYINKQMATNFPDVITVQSPQPYFGTFNCHFFAWNNNQGYTIWSGPENIWQNGTPSQYIWIHYPTSYFSDEAYGYGYSSYVTSTESSAPIAVYRNNGTIMHSARRLSGSTELISKWGTWGIYQHSPTEVPSTYGTITERYEINPSYRPVGNGDPGGRDWGTISDALSDIPSNSIIPVYPDTPSLTGNILIPSNVNLYIKPSATLNLSNYSIINDGGTITIASGGTINGLKAEIKDMYTLAVKGLYSSIETAINSSLATGNRVYIQSGTFSGISIYGKDDLTIRGTASTYFTGTLDFYYCDNLDLASLECESLNMAYCDDAILSINIYGSSSQIGIHLTSCSNYYATGNVSNCNFGARTYASSGWFSTDYYENNNTSFYSIASSDLGVHQVKLCESINYDYQAVSNGHISAYGCYVKDGTSRTYTYEGGTIDIGSSLDCGSLMGKENDLSLMQIQSDDPVETEFSKINTSYFDLLKTINEEDEESGKRELYSQLLTIVENFKTFITNNPKSSLSHVALNTAANSFSLFEDYDGMKSFLDEIINDKELVSLKGEAENLMTEYYGKVKDFDRAISTADAVIENYESDDEILCDALFRKGMMLAYQMEQPKEAIEYFATIVNNYKENPLYETAVYQLETLGEGIIEEPEEDQAEENSGIETSVYPNPFNPATTISYTLPEEGRVSIKIYDVLGREVETLVNEIRTAGTHSVEWNGSRYSSGIYFYSVTFMNQTLYKKMLMVK